MRTWSTLPQGGTQIDAKIAAPSLRSPKRRISQCTESLKSGLTKSADGSIAQRTRSSNARPRGGRHVGLDKMCLLMEVRIAPFQTVRGVGEGAKAPQSSIATHTLQGQQLSGRRRGAHVLGAQNLEKARRFDPTAGVLGSECPIPVGMLVGGVHSLLTLP